MYYDVISVLVLGLALALYLYHSRISFARLTSIKTPLNVPRVIDPDAASSARDPARLWGSYAPGLYFGMKTRTPYSPVVGLMWMTNFGNDTDYPPIRHWCDQADGLVYGWLAHDGVNFGIQHIEDLYYSLSVDFVKRQGGEHGGDWSARIRVKTKPEFGKLKMSLFVYVALEEESKGFLSADIDEDRITTIRGITAELGKFALVFPKPHKSSISNYLVGYAPSLDKLREVLKHAFIFKSKKGNEALARYLCLAGERMPDEIPASRSNFIVSQLTADAPFDMEMAFESGSIVDRPHPLLGERYQAALEERLTDFNKLFDQKFNLANKGYDNHMVSFAKTTLSNLIGGIGYFHGSSLVKSRHLPEPTDYWNASLYTAVPSRSSFPRGFLWDEGFHNILISQWNSSIAMDIIGHWLDLINFDGWIPREQILGVEARAKVPAEFVVQDNEHANPPTFFLPLRKIAKNLDVHSREFLRSIYPRLKTWYRWYERTLAGDVKSTYRWRGRNVTSVYELNPKTFSSGFDDYPRSSHPSADERHLDLRCWMALASGVMSDIARTLNEPSSEYEDTHRLLTDNRLLDELHWSERHQMYSDYGLHTDDVHLARPLKILNTLERNQVDEVESQKERVVITEPALRYVDRAFGYVSLFPFLLGIVDADSPKLGKILDDLKKENLLWTRYGLRSLAKNSPMYNEYNTEHEPPCWRGAVWINVNYMALSALHSYSKIAGPYQKAASAIYVDLRKNVVGNVFEQWKLTGYVWDRYDDVTGVGKGNNAFTGWSALVVAIMAEYYD